MTNQNIRKNLYNQCFSFCEVRRQRVQLQADEIKEALTSETKSSAGDKHETGRAMLQLEREKIGAQLAENQKLQEVLSKIEETKASAHICLGSVVKTTRSNYYLAISAGELEVDSLKYYAISPYTPIGQLLIGKTIGDQIQFRDQDFAILEVF